MIVSNWSGRHIGLFDIHLPHNIDLSNVLGYIHDHGCEHLILGGDIMNLEWASHWNERVFSELGRTKLKELLYDDIDNSVTELLEIKKAAPKKSQIWYIPGNHEMWLWYACFHHRIIDAQFRSADFTFRSDVAKLMEDGLRRLLDQLLGLPKLGITCLKYNELLRLGKIVYLHGQQFTGRNPTHNSRTRWPHVNVVFGHHHTEERVTLHNSADPCKSIQHTAVPGLCGLAPGYLKDASTRWLNGFWIADCKDGLFDGRVKKVFNGKIIP